MMRKLLLALILVPLLANAESLPVPGSTDPRVRKVAYNPNQVYRVPTFYGVNTHIQFESDEVLQDVASGDDTAWDIKPRKTHLFIRPLEHKPDTNLTVTTSKGRVYQFMLVLSKLDEKDENAWRNGELIYSLSFTYPEVEAARAKTALAESDAKAKQKLAEAKLHAGRLDGQSNEDYWIAGNPDASPTRVTDDGSFTRITFSHGRRMPAVYEVDQAGNEHLVPWNVEGNTLVLHRVYRKLVLRKGDAVACLVNKSFSLDGGRDMESGTVSPNVERVVRGAK